MAAFTDDNLRHLLRRTEFVVRPERLAVLQATGNLAAAVADVLALDRNPLRADRGPVPYFDTADDTDRGWVQYARAADWWVDYVARGGSIPDGPATPPPAEWRAFQEKMVLFWHGHFVSSWSQIHKGVHLMWQLHGYRKRALGSLVDLAQSMAVSPAMLVYLSNSLNVKGEPNQNFARELMELFTMGVGNYTEADVDAVARAWTGHNYDYTSQRYVFVGDSHDYGAKTLFGVTANWNGPEVIDTILVDNPAKAAVAARFIARKLWEFLAYIGPDASLVDYLAGVLVGHGMQVAPLVRAILLHDEFYSTRARQGLVRQPLEWIFAVAYHTNMRGADLRLIDNTQTPDSARMARSELTGQLIFQPPNVSGWRPNGYWLSNSGMSGRAQLASTAADFVLGNAAATPLSFDPRDSVGTVVDRVAAYFGVAYPPDSTTRAALVAALGGVEAAPFPADGARDVLMLTMLAPEMHLA